MKRASLVLNHLEIFLGWTSRPWNSKVRGGGTRLHRPCSLGSETNQEPLLGLGQLRRTVPALPSLKTIFSSYLLPIHNVDLERGLIVRLS